MRYNINIKEGKSAREYTTNEKDRIIARIVGLEKNLVQAREDLKKFE